MTEEVFIDSSVFISFLVEGKDVFNKLKNYKLITSVNVLEEVAYVLIKERAKEITGITANFKLLQHLRKNSQLVRKISEEVINDINILVKILEIQVVLPANYEEMFECIKTYGLLPNDALIAATCKHYGIKKIATFDKDFKKIDFLEIIE